MLNGAKAVLAVIAGSRSEKSLSNLTAFIATLTERPKYFEGRTRIEGERGIEESIYDTCLTNWGIGNPLIATAEDVC